MLNKKAREQLRRLLPISMVATKQWLLDQGLNLHFVDNAVRSRTLIPITTGVYTLYEQPIRWPGIVASLQRMLGKPIHVGGLTALHLAGYSHFLSFSAEERIELYSESPLPGWLRRVPIDVVFDRGSTTRLWPESVMTNPRYLRAFDWQEGLPPVSYSCPEKAMLEVLTKVPSAVSFEHADSLMQGLSNLSPRKLNALMEACLSIKTKRLFLWLSERQNHPWFKYLEPEKYDLGAGKRVIAEEGRLNKKWSITVPREMQGDNGHG